MVAWVYEEITKTSEVRSIVRSMVCPKCGLINTPTTDQCDCGFTLPASQRENEPRFKRGFERLNRTEGPAAQVARRRTTDELRRDESNRRVDELKRRRPAISLISLCLPFLVYWLIGQIPVTLTPIATNATVHCAKCQRVATRATLRHVHIAPGIYAVRDLRDWAQEVYCDIHSPPNTELHPVLTGFACFVALILPAIWFEGKIRTAEAHRDRTNKLGLRR